MTDLYLIVLIWSLEKKLAVRNIWSFIKLVYFFRTQSYKFCEMFLQEPLPI